MKLTKITQRIEVEPVSQINTLSNFYRTIIIVMDYTFIFPEQE